MIDIIIFLLFTFAAAIIITVFWSAMVLWNSRRGADDAHEFEHGDPNVIHHTRVINGTHRAEWPERKTTARIRDIEPRGA